MSRKRKSIEGKKAMTVRVRREMDRAKKKVKKKRLTYSPQERALLDLLPTNGKRIDTKQLAAKRWPRDRPFYANSIVNSTLRNLIEKVKRNGEDFRIVKGPRLGPKPISYHVEDRSRAALNGGDS